MNTHEISRQNDFKALHWLHLFGMLRAIELGALMWPEIKSQQTSGSRLAKSLIQRHLVIERRLPEGSGRVLVLSSAGVRLLVKNRVNATSGKGLGMMVLGAWTPPHSWRHDLLATGVLTRLFLQGYEIFPEHHLRRCAGPLAKIPDGLARKGDEVLWLEVEQSRKSGKHMRDLANGLCGTSYGDNQLIGLTPNTPCVAFVPGAQDERGYALNHEGRVRNAIQMTAKKTVSVLWCECTLRGPAGVGGIHLRREAIQPSAVMDILGHLDRNGWNRLPDDTIYSRYQSYRAEVWFDHQQGWSLAVIDVRDNEQVGGGAGDAQSLADAQEQVAARIAGLINIAEL